MATLKEERERMMQWQMFYLGGLSSLLGQSRANAELAINCTRTSVGRNMLTEINMQLMQLQDKLQATVERIVAENETIKVNQPYPNTPE